MKFSLRSNKLGFDYIQTTYNKPDNALDQTLNAEHFFTKYARVSDWIGLLIQVTPTLFLKKFSTNLILFIFQTLMLL